MSRRTKRVIRELRNYETDKKDINESGIYIHYDESDLTVIQCLIFGPTETPYHNIPFIFEITCPDSYPFNPPKVKYIGFSSHRIHPNLYVNGKVCLSILGTWTGPSWSASSSIIIVLKTIQSILLSDSITNEPGIKSSNPGCKSYDQIILYDMFFNVYPHILQYKDEHPNLIPFSDTITRHFHETKDLNLKYLQTYFKNLDSLTISSTFYKSWQVTIKLDALIEKLMSI